MTNYIYLLYGPGDDCYVEAAYSLGTLRKRIDADTDRIIVFTDQPERVKDWPVVCESIVGELAAMRGKANFSYRAKLCVILKCLEKFPGNVIYLDSDTSVRGDVVKLAARLSSETAIMHSFECLNPEIGLAGFHTQLNGGISYRFSPTSQMYNAGVIGLHEDHREVVRRALELCDAMLEFGGSRMHTTEQFAMSEALRISDLKVWEARSVVTHYMGHRFYLREKIHEMIIQTGRPPWQFENPVSYSRIKVYWLRKFGYYRNSRNKLK